MNYKLTSTVLALTTGLALCGCAVDTSDGSEDPDALAAESTEAEASTAPDEADGLAEASLGETSDALRGDRGRRGGGDQGGGDHHGGGQHADGGRHGGWGHFGGGEGAWRHGGGFDRDHRGDWGQLRGHRGDWGQFRGQRANWGDLRGRRGGWGHVSGGHYSRLERGHWGYGRGGVVVVGQPVYMGVPQAYYGWIRYLELEQQCRAIGWASPDCSFATSSAVCIPDVGCFVRPY